MTPEEQAVISAAITWATVQTRDEAEDAADALQDVVGALLIDRGQGSAPEVPEDPPIWVETTMKFCLAGDRIRLGAEETDVIRSNTGIWHADVSDAWHPKAWQHLELRMELAAVPGFKPYPAGASVEILMTDERQAAHVLMAGFPGTSVITSSDVN